MQAKRCSACGRTFGCGRDEGACWCGTRPALPAAARVAAGDCLCPRCLDQRIAAAGAARAEGDPER
jgi:hypothetical protein